MNLRATHLGYAYQDLITAIALVDLMLGAAVSITVDTKGFEGDRFDDLNIRYRTSRRVRLQIKHTTQDRELAKETFSADGRNLKLNKLLDSLLHDLAEDPEADYRVVVRDGGPDEDLAKVLKPVEPSDDPGDPLPGVTTRRFRFDPQSLRESKPWKALVEHLTDEQLQAACGHLTIDTGAPASTLDFNGPGPAERVLLRRVTEELGAGRPPNSHITPEHAALELAYAATGARALDGNVARESVAPRVGLITDFGAVAEGHPVESAVAVPRSSAVAIVREAVDAIAPAGGRVVVTGEPGVGKSWLCEQLADHYRDANWIVARHHCWFGATDINRDERVLTDVVIGSLIRQLEQVVPEATAGLRPRFAATPEALAAAVQECRDTHAERNVLLIVDGLDHVDRVLGRRTNQQIDPSRLLVDQLAAIDLPPGVCMLIASQPGPHLENAGAAAGGPMQMPRMSWDEVRTLAEKHGLLGSRTDDDPLDVDDERKIVDLVYDRSGGNALYATYLCRYAARISPLDADTAPVTPADIVHRLTLVPDTATDLDAYYAHLLGAMTRRPAVRHRHAGPVRLRNERGRARRDAAPGKAASVARTRDARTGSELTTRPRRSAHPSRKLQPAHPSRQGRGVGRIDPREHGRVAGGPRFLHATRGRSGTFPNFSHSWTGTTSSSSSSKPGFVAEGIRAFHPPEALLRVVGVACPRERGSARLADPRCMCGDPQGHRRLRRPNRCPTRSSSTRTSWCPSSAPTSSLNDLYTKRGPHSHRDGGCASATPSTRLAAQPRGRPTSKPGT